MTVSFIIPLFNCLAHTRECLRTLAETIPAGLVHEILLVDDGSTDGTREWLATLESPCRAILNETNLGFAGACNRGARSATGEVLFFLNNDLIFRRGWLEPMLKTSRLPDSGLTGNVQVDAKTRRIDHAGSYFNHKGKPEHLKRAPFLARILGSCRTSILTGACFSVRRRLWNEMGGFDEGFKNGGEDTDLCLRAESAGYVNRICTRSVVRHHISQSPGRKLRDEQNSHRLISRWRAVISRLAARDWCRNHLVSHKDPSTLLFDPFGREVLFYWLGLLREPPPSVVAGVDSTIGIEMERWEKMFGPDS